MTAKPPASLVGALVEVEVGAIAHGGHCVARHEGRVVFVRHAIPGELVVACVTGGGPSSRYLRADSVQVLKPSPDRVEPPCPFAGPGRCGGCDFQHVALARQRELLAAVVREQLSRLAGVEWPVVVEPVDGDREGLEWRSRVRFTATLDRRPGLRRHRSHEVIAIDNCRIARPGLPDVAPALAAGYESAEAVVASTGDRAVVTDRRTAPAITERTAGREWRLNAGDFWQVHPGAADALVGAVLDGVQPQLGERCWDLYAGVGLFAAALAERVGPTGAVVAVESHRGAVDSGQFNLRDLDQVRWITDRVERFVRSRIAQGRLDVVVLDPPRSGAGRSVVQAIAKCTPRAIGYVACDPAALARDVATLAEAGYELASLRGFDIFPMTHHVECVAAFRRVRSVSSRA
ncbi:MAG: class I SAM-dependent RNA methyltransferase [Nocardioidaceae bacterium]